MAYKGYLHKTEQGWIVIYDQRTMQDPSAEDGILLVSDYGDREAVLDEKQNLNFYSGKEVDFEMVEEKFDGNNTMTYARIIHKTIKSEQNDVERLAEEVYGKGVNYDYEEGFVDGYNKAKETLYTEEQVREAIRLTHSSNRRYLDWLENDIIQSLKQK
jgi:hypothetical protein